MKCAIGVFLLSAVISAGAACAPREEASSASAVQSAAGRTKLAALVRDLHVVCARDKYGSSQCGADGYRLESAGCGASQFYGRIAVTGGVMLQDHLARDNAHEVAHLQENQFVCIEVTATKEGKERDFVRAVPVATVPGCKGNTLCTTYRDRPIKWSVVPSDKPCHRLKDGSYVGACAAGWIDKEALEDFSMGL